MLYRGMLVVLAVTSFWAVWASAQPTNPAADTLSATTSLIPSDVAKTNALTTALSQVGFLQETKLLGEPLWKYLASIIYIVLAFYVAKLLDFVINVWLRRWAAKTDTKYDDLVLDLLHGPVKVVAFVVFLHIGLGVFDWPARAQLFLSRGLIVVVACSITYVALKVVDLLLGVWRERSSTHEDKLFTEHLFPVIRKAAKVVVAIVAVLLTADNLGIKITSILAGLSVGGLALGLAAQDTVANLFGAVAIFLDKPFRIGDRIKIDAVDGAVESIGLRSTRVRNLDGHLVTIPNKIMGNAVITNVTQRPNVKTELNFGLTYDTPPDRVQRATDLLREIFSAHPKTADLIVTFNRFDNSALNIQVLHWWNGTDYKQYTADLQALNLQVKRRFDADGLEFAFPTQTLYVKQA